MSLLERYESALLDRYLDSVDCRCREVWYCDYCGTEMSEDLVAWHRKVCPDGPDEDYVFKLDCRCGEELDYEDSDEARWRDQG